ncbi:MAG: methyltransferase domain-containing protein [Candidatus Hodarchaeota archaeon]
MKPINLVKRSYTVNQFLERYASEDTRILNIGSSSTRFLNYSVNLDIQKKPDVDIIGDAHTLPFKSSVFNIVILSAVLQYCKNPYKVASEAYRVLSPKGHVYLDAPFVQPYCYDTPDLFRFTKDGLILIFENFSILECDVSIPGGSALAFFIQSLVGNSKNRYLNFALKTVFSLLALPIALINYNKKSNVAGAFYLIGKK